MHTKNAKKVGKPLTLHYFTDSHFLARSNPTRSVQRSDGYSNPYDFESDTETYEKSYDGTAPVTKQQTRVGYANMPSVNRVNPPYVNMNGNSIYYVTL